MSDSPDQKNRTDARRPEDSRAHRLKAALKANLGRRKAQVRLRKAEDAGPGSASQEPGGQD